MCRLGFPGVLLLAGLVGMAGLAGLAAAQGVVLADGTLAHIVKYLVHTAKTPTRVVAVLCESTRGRALGRALSAEGLQVEVVDREDAWGAALAPTKEAVTVVLDAACPGAAQMLATADRTDQLRSRVRWVLLNVGTATSRVDANQTALAERGVEPQARDAKQQLRAEDAVPRSANLDACYARLDGLLDGLGVLQDSDVSAICVDKEDVVAVYAYRPAPDLGLRLQLVARWPVPSRTHSLSSARMQADRRDRAGRRMDLEETVVNVAFVVEIKNRFANLVARGGISPDIMAAFTFDMIHYITAMVNATINVTLVDTYGQTAKPNTMPTTGLLAMMIRGEVELAGSPLVLMADPVRLKYCDYTNFFVPFSGEVVFRAPPLSYEYNVFTLPFPATVWGVATFMVGLCTAILSLVLYAESSRAADRDDDGDEEDQHDLHTTGDAFLMAVAAVCQQGYTKDLRSIPGRIVVLVMLTLLLLLYTCYSASIVVLMQSTSSKVTHYRDLLTTQMKFGMTNIPYVIFFASTETEPVRHKLYKDKILDKGRHKHLYSVTDGVRKVQKEYFAYYGIQNHIYEVIQRTWTEEEKCGLVIMGKDFIRFKDPQVVVHRSSHNAKAFKIGIRKMTERGIWHRSFTRYTNARPSCANKAAAFNSVSLTDVRGAFFMLLSLMTFSVAALLGELAWHRRQTSRKKARARRALQDRVEAFAVNTTIKM